MERVTINGIANAYIKGNLSPTETERNLVKREYDLIKRIVGGICIQSGSWARYTSTTPINDLDIIWEVPLSLLEEDVANKMRGGFSPGDYDPAGVLRRLARILADGYEEEGRRVRIETQSHSVGIYFGEDDEFSIDIVPAISSGHENEYGHDVYWVPEIARLSKSARSKKYLSGDSIGWLLSDPRGYIEDARELNESNESFRKVAKFARKWRRGCKKKNDGEFPLKAFHLELVVNDLFKSNREMDTITGLETLFAKLPEYLTSPRFQDRANPSRYVDENVAVLTQTQKDTLRSMAAAAHAKLVTLPDASSTADVYTAFANVVRGSSASTTAAAFSAAASYTPAASFEPLRTYGTIEN